MHVSHSAYDGNGCVECSSGPFNVALESSIISQQLSTKIQNFMSTCASSKHHSCVLHGEGRIRPATPSDRHQTIQQIVLVEAEDNCKRQC